MAKTDPEEALALYDEGRAAMKKQDLLVAIAKFKEAVMRAPHYKTYELLGECLLQREAYCEAALYLAAAAGLGNKEFKARYLLAQTLLKLDDKEDAIQKLDEALALNANFKAARELRAQLLTHPKQ